MRRGSRKALSSQSRGNVKKRVDPLTKGGCDEVDYTVAFTPKGGCPLKLSDCACPSLQKLVAFTPKGGCPLKPLLEGIKVDVGWIGSIHPQGWVPIETGLSQPVLLSPEAVAFTPKGGCPLKPVGWNFSRSRTGQ